MALIPAELRSDNLFRIGLLVRLASVLLLVPVIQKEWFVDFLVETLSPPSLDPWTGYLGRSGDPLAFPYGPAMYLFHVPTVAIGMLLDRLLGAGRSFAQIGFATSLLLADLWLLVTLHRLLPGNPRRLLIYYWWSPIILVVTYWHGQTDIVPTLLVALCLLMLQQLRPDLAALSLGLGIAAKLSSAMVFPFVLIFLWLNRRYRHWLLRFVVITIGVVAVLQVPWLLQPGAQGMILASPEIAKIFDVALELRGGARIYILPMCYLLMIYLAWQIGRMNLDFLLSVLGVMILTILLLTPASLGWYCWIVPYLVFYQMQEKPVGAALAVLLSLCFVGVKMPTVTGATLPALGIDLGLPLAERLPWLLTPHLLSLGASTLAALGIIVAAAMLKHARQSNDFYKLSRKPLLIGIAGDSGTGKDTLSAALAGLFGHKAVASVSGDDYHLYERKGPLWQATTHLAPQANDLRSFTLDVHSLLEGRAILCRHYDHETGLFTRRRQIAANDVILVSGLHALYPASLRQRMDLSVFLDMDETLRRHLKIRRDVGERGHTLDHVLASLDRRSPDFAKYIAPQADLADLALSLQPAVEGLDARAGTTGRLPLRLRARMRNSIRHAELARALVVHCALRVDVEDADRNGTVDLLVEGDVSAEDVAFAATILVPHIEELLPLEPVWQAGMTGIMQLCILVRLGERKEQQG